MTLDEVREKCPDQLKAMVDDEVKAVQDQYERRREHGKRKITYNAAYNIAYKRVCQWIEDAREETVDLSNLVELARYVAGHRTAKTWAMIIGRAEGESDG